jgi:outer membrane scaffolding protein for murein synthesis (MipA/OmpV family)
MSLTPRLSALLLPLLFATPALAQDNASDGVVTTQEAEGDRVLIGVGAGYTPSYEGSDSYVLVPVPVAQGRISGFAFTLRGARLYVDMVPDDGGPGWDYQLGPAVSINLNRTSQIKDRQVEALGELDPAIEVGGFVGLGRTGLITSEYDKLTVSVTYLRDVAGVHDSHVIIPSIDYGTPLSTKAFVGIGFSAEYVGEGYADTYYSVTPAGRLASGLPVFDADAGWKSYTVSALANHSITGDLTGGLSLIASGSYRRMLEDSARSPIVSVAGSKDQWFGMLGLAYTF